MMKYKIKNNRFKFFLSLALLYALLIFYLSSNPNLGDPKGIINFFHVDYLRSFLKPIEQSNTRFLLFPLYIFVRYPDKIGHIVLYMVFGVLLYLTFKNSSNPTLNNYAFMFAIILGSIYGLSDELHQYFVPGRRATIRDFLLDNLGLSISQIIIFLRANIKK